MSTHNKITAEALTILKYMDERVLTAPEKWGQRKTAADPDGRSVLAQSDDAVCWCIYGAMDRAAHFTDIHHGPATNLVSTTLVRAIMLSDLCTKLADIVSFNDKQGRKFDDVKQVLALAKQELEKGEQA